MRAPLTGSALQGFDHLRELEAESFSSDLKARNHAFFRPLADSANGDSVSCRNDFRGNDPRAFLVVYI